jgi:hypothetical protein
MFNDHGGSIKGPLVIALPRIVEPAPPINSSITLGNRHLTTRDNINEKAYLDVTDTYGKVQSILLEPPIRRGVIYEPCFYKESLTTCLLTCYIFTNNNWSQYNWARAEKSSNRIHPAVARITLCNNIVTYKWYRCENALTDTNDHMFFFTRSQGLHIWTTPANIITWNHETFNMSTLPIPDGYTFGRNYFYCLPTSAEQRNKVADQVAQVYIRPLAKIISLYV